MIKEIFIQNYLSHKRTSLKLHEGVNVFIGLSDNGKSAIIKAIKEEQDV
jgi:exonuclease SbcC